MNPQPEIGIIIPFHNGDEVIGRCLESIAASSLAGARVYLVDNSSRKTQVAAIAGRFPFVQILATAPALGFGRACNHGAATAVAAGAQVLVFVNQDTVLAPDCLGELVRALQEHRDLALVAPLNWSMDFDHLEEGFTRFYLGRCSRLITDAVRGKLQPLYRVDAVPGSCIALPVRVYQRLGLFDEIYFMYAEDDDLCRRYRNAGGEIAFVTAAHVGHVNALASAPAGHLVKWRQRASSHKYRLKDPQGDFLKGCAIVCREILLDAVRFASRGQLRLLTACAGDSFRLLGQLPAIYRARERERRLLASVPRTSPLRDVSRELTPLGENWSDSGIGEKLS